MTLKDALKRIEELERKVAALEARPPEQHTHYHTSPQYQMTPYAPSLTYEITSTGGGLA